MRFSQSRLSENINGRKKAYVSRQFFAISYLAPVIISRNNEKSLGIIFSLRLSSFSVSFCSVLLNCELRNYHVLCVREPSTDKSRDCMRSLARRRPHYMHADGLAHVPNAYTSRSRFASSYIEASGRFQLRNYSTVSNSLFSNSIGLVKNIIKDHIPMYYILLVFAICCRN